MMEIAIFIFAGLMIAALIFFLLQYFLASSLQTLNQQFQQEHIAMRDQFIQQLNDFKQTQLQSQHQLLESITEKFNQHRQRFDEHQLNSMKTLHDSLQQGFMTVRQTLIETLLQHNQETNRYMDKLSKTVDERLREISGQVEKRLSEGFEKTTATFTDIVKRLALIDEAQKKITELSTNVVSLQEILSDKRARGAFGEVQLMALIRNVIPEQHFKTQYQLSNDKRVDCMLFLPEPTGNVAIDSKFPLETYRLLEKHSLNNAEKQSLEQQFRIDIRKHVQDISNKYILPGETADGAIMFIPAEAIFAEIHSYYPDLVEYAQKMRVWLVSPTTMMAILTTTRAVLKDAATRQQIHIIQEHLTYLGKDFQRFQKRMDALSKHIHLAHDDIELVHTSAKKIASRFQKIEQVELDQHTENETLPINETEITE